jgi:hypothetical protein
MVGGKAGDGKTLLIQHHFLAAKEFLTAAVSICLQLSITVE